ncbi:hypothetical protein P9112_006642 [Eukaryota sp. TZLM1-RC]
MSLTQFTAKEDLKSRITDLSGFTQRQWDEHWKLYKGYVNNSNQLMAELREAREANREDRFVQDRRRLEGFEISGILLHEIYFGSIVNGGSKMTPEFTSVINKHFGSVDFFMADLTNTVKTRGVGWACVYYDKDRDSMWIGHVELHQNGHAAGVQIVLALDCWEHGYVIDFGTGPTGLASLWDALKPHLDWVAIEQRYRKLSQ